MTGSKLGKSMSQPVGDKISYDIAAGSNTGYNVPNSRNFKNQKYCKNFVADFRNEANQLTSAESDICSPDQVRIDLDRWEKNLLNKRPDFDYDINRNNEINKKQDKFTEDITHDLSILNSTETYNRIQLTKSYNMKHSMAHTKPGLLVGKSLLVFSKSVQVSNAEDSGKGADGSEIGNVDLAKSKKNQKVNSILEQAVANPSIPIFQKSRDTNTSPTKAEACGMPAGDVLKTHNEIKRIMVHHICHF